MPTTNRRRSGILAKQNGSSFENMFKTRCTYLKVACTRIPDSCRRVGSGPRDLQQVKSPFDFIISFQGRAAIIDTKTTAEASFKRVLITEHQVEELVQHEKQGVSSGYVVHLRKVSRVVFISAATLIKATKNPESLTLDDDGVIDLGSLFDFDVRKIFLETQIVPTSRSNT